MSDIKETISYDHAEGKIIVKRVQDMEPFLNQVKRDKEAFELVNKPVDGLGYYAGTIPPMIIEQYMKKVGVSYRDFMIDPAHVKRILTDPDFKEFRVWEGKF